MVEKVGFTNCVFDVSFFWKHYLYSVFSKTQLFINKNCMLKKTENLWKIVDCFWTWQNGVLGVCFFEVLMSLWFVFGVSGIVPEVFKCLFSQFFGAFVAALILVYFGFGRFRCFCVSCVCSCSCVAFVSVLIALFLFCCWIVFGVGYCFAFVFFSCLFVLVLFCFLRVEGSGEVAQRATSLGPKPSLF